MCALYAALGVVGVLCFIAGLLALYGIFTLDKDMEGY